MRGHRQSAPLLASLRAAITSGVRARFTNYGQLLPPAPIADAPLRKPTAARSGFATLKGKWVFLTVDSGRCEALCQDKLYKMRQVRLTQGAEHGSHRARLADRRRRAPGCADWQPNTKARTRCWRRAARCSAQLPAEASVRDHIYIVDPLGNVMMRYRTDADPTG